MTQPPVDPHFGSPLGVPSFLPNPPRYAAPEDWYDERTSPYIPQAAAPVPQASPSMPQAAPFVPQAAPYVPQPNWAPQQASAYVMPTAPVKNSPLMGIIGLCLVVVAAVAYYLFCQALYSSLFATMDIGSISNASVTGFSQQQMEQFQGLASGIGFSSLVGIGGFVTSIVATAQDKGRPYSITGIVLGALAPFLIFVALFVAMYAVMPH